MASADGVKAFTDSRTDLRQCTRRALPAVWLAMSSFPLKDGGFETRRVCRRTQSACAPCSASPERIRHRSFSNWFVAPVSPKPHSAIAFTYVTGIANAQRPEATNDHAPKMIKRFGGVKYRYLPASVPLTN